MKTMTLTVGYVAEAFIDELCSMVERDPHRKTEQESAFLGDDTKPRTIAIGKYLYKLGGEKLMGEVCSKVFERHRWSGRSLEMAWNGIGDWEA